MTIAMDEAYGTLVKSTNEVNKWMSEWKRAIERSEYKSWFSK